MSPEDLKFYTNLFAKHFVARTDAIAVQTSNGGYMPVKNRSTQELVPWSRKHFEDHLNCRATYGHYLLNAKSQCKLFAFDIDFRKGKEEHDKVLIPTEPLPTDEDHIESWQTSFELQSPLEAWKNRKHPARQYLKTALREITSALYNKIEMLDVPALSAYTGNKGSHVYGFTGLMDAASVREGADMIIEALGWQPSKGSNFYRDESTLERSLFEIEVFPKQTTITDGSFGNLMRLPLGKNQKSNDPTFFINENTYMGDLKPMTRQEIEAVFRR